MWLWRNKTSLDYSVLLWQALTSWDFFPWVIFPHPSLILGPAVHAGQWTSLITWRWGVRTRKRGAKAVYLEVVRHLSLTQCIFRVKLINMNMKTQTARYILHADKKMDVYEHIRSLSQQAQHRNRNPYRPVHLVCRNRTPGAGHRTTEACLSPGAGKSMLKGWQVRGLGRASFLADGCLLTAGAFSTALIRAPVPFMWAPPLGPNHLSMSPPPETLCGGSGFNMWIRGDTNMQP